MKIPKNTTKRYTLHRFLVQVPPFSLCVFFFYQNYQHSDEYQDGNYEKNRLYNGFIFFLLFGFDAD